MLLQRLLPRIVRDQGLRAEQRVWEEVEHHQSRLRQLHHRLGHIRRTPFPLTQHYRQAEVAYGTRDMREGIQVNGRD